jgi:AcrR family transcriptional regulator
MPSAPTTRLPRAERRTQLLGVAASSFLAAGFGGTSVEDVAKAAGVTRVIVYRVFENKEQLYRAVLASVVEELRDVFVGDGAQIRLETHGAAKLLLDIARRQPDAFRLLWRHAAHEPEFAALAAEFRRGADDYADFLLGTSVADADLRRWCAAAMTAYLYDGICTWLDHHHDTDRDEEFVRLLRGGSRALVSSFAR